MPTVQIVLECNRLGGGVDRHQLPFSLSTRIYGHKGLEITVSVKPTFSVFHGV